MIVLVMLHLHHSVERSAFLRIQFSLEDVRYTLNNTQRCLEAQQNKNT